MRSKSHGILTSLELSTKRNKLQEEKKQGSHAGELYIVDLSLLFFEDIFKPISEDSALKRQLQRFIGSFFGKFKHRTVLH